MNGPYGNRFPYVNFHEMNLDWMIQVAKDFLDQYTTIQDDINHALEAIPEEEAAGIRHLQRTYEQLDGQLTDWYNEHSQDIRGELADALEAVQAAVPLAVADFRVQAQAVADEVIESIPDDYTELSNSVAELLATLANILHKEDTTLEFEQGFISDTTGAASPSYPTKYIRTPDYHKFAYGITFEVPATMSVLVYRYTSASYSDYVDHTVYTDDFTIIDNTHYYKFCYHLVSDADITTSDADDVDAKLLFFTDDTLTMHQAPADAYTVGKYLFNPTLINPAWEQGAYNSSTGGATTGANRCRSVRALLFKRYIKITVPSGWKLYWYRYTGWSYTTYTGGSGGWLTGTVTLPDDAFYKFAVAKSGDGNITPDDVYDAGFTIEVGLPANLLTPLSANATYELEAMLSTYRHVEIMPGTYNITRTITDFYDGTELVGCGWDTILYFDNSATGAVLRVGNKSIVKNLQLQGRATDYLLEDDDPSNVVPETMGNRHGIEITGNIRRGTIDSVYAHGFNGYGIYAHDNSTPSNQGYSIVNCVLCNNHGGLYTRQAEFMRIVGCDMNQNRVGMFNGGGNNNISCCNMSSNYIGINMDNSDSSLVNNTHGGFSCCSVQHSRTWAIYANNVASGEVFTGCNIDDAGLCAVNSYRLIFSGCNFMQYFFVDINGGGLIMFIGCNMRDNTQNDSSIVNNNNVKFINCYQANGTPVDPTT